MMSEDVVFFNEGAAFCPELEVFFLVVSGFSPPALVVQHGRRHGRGWAGQGHSGLRVDDRDNLPGPGDRWLLEIHLVDIPGHTRVHVRVGGRRRQRDGRSNLLDGLNLVLKGRSIRGSTGHGRPVRSGMNGVDLYYLLQLAIQNSFPFYFYPRIFCRVRMQGMCGCNVYDEVKGGGR